MLENDKRRLNINKIIQKYQSIKGRTAWVIGEKINSHTKCRII
jgi:hypothetical protein